MKNHKLDLGGSLCVSDMGSNLSGMKVIHPYPETVSDRKERYTTPPGIIAVIVCFFS
jgi:hypothetical protein